MTRYLFALIVGLAGCGILVALGVWQLGRLEWKEAILAEIDARMTEAPQALPELPNEEDDEYLPVEVTGTFTGAAVHVLIPGPDGLPGFRVIEGFETDTGRVVLIDRGIVPEALKYSELTAPRATVQGNLLWPDEADWFTPVPDTERNTWFARELEPMASYLQAEPLLIVARTRTDPVIEPLPINSADIPNDHFNYAVTWFLLAAVWAVMTVFWLIRTRREA